MNVPRCAAPAVLASVVAITPAIAQGRFVNFEDPQIKPVTIATVTTGGLSARVALLCNTPDNSVEIWRTASPFAFVGRVPVGLSPVTVRWNAADQRLYTCNFLGDSVTVAHLELAGATIRATVERTIFVGDEPSDIAFVQNNTQAVVSLASRSSVAQLALPALSVISPNVPLTVPSGTAGVTWAVKMPRTIAVLADQRSYVLNHMGGNSQAAYDLDLFVSDPNNPPAGQTANFWGLGGMGTTNFNFAIDSAGRRMFVVGQRAHIQQLGVDAVAAQATGFAQSWLSVVDLVPGAPGGPPALAPEQSNGTALPKPLFQSINLNRDYRQTGLVALPATQAVAQPTDVVLVESAGTVQRIALAAFGSDKVILLTPDANQYSGYAVTSVTLPLVNPTANYSAVGPRGLALDPQGIDPQSTGTRGLIWIANRLDNSFAIVNPWNGRIVLQRALRADPTPAAIRAGRQFLYTAERTSGSRMVSCASCHIDARTDGLPWNLGNLDAPGPAIATWLHDGDGHDLTTMPDFPNAKGFMITQTLQGLLNCNVEPAAMKFVATNAPYHWRGDKGTFQDFNEAFVRLLRMPDDPLQPGDNGLTAAQMDTYTAFIDTIHHPPNPEQWKDRTFHGDFGDPDDPLTGSGGALGLKLFHTVGFEDQCGGRSCVQCHALPDGSSNTLPLVEAVDGFLGTPAQDHPFESAALRNLFQREMALPPPGFQPTADNLWTRTAGFGLLHEGGALRFGPTARGLNDFVHRAFKGSLPGTAAQREIGANALVEFLRQFDTGTAPAVGFAWTWSQDPLQAPLNTAALNLLERQSEEANVGLAVSTRSGTTTTGFWHDAAAALYRQENGAQTLTRAQLILFADVPGNVVILQGTPAGSERRVASASGSPAILAGAQPANVTLLPMVPDTAWVDVPRLSANWDPAGAIPFVWSGPGAPPQSLAATRTLQTALVGSFGVPALRHEPPRRFRVTGDNIRPGARVSLAMATSTPGTWPGQPVWFDLHATRYKVNGRTVWETTEELDPMQTLAWLCGGYWAPGVAEILQGLPQTRPLAPAVWNRFAVAVQNEDSTLGLSPTWQVLTIADMR
ncbi:MAG: hypothetical protein IPK26_19590 [Planctomycetes bacterium]|nr:hypothetical protein [Planctomycetota bacterium]